MKEVKLSNGGVALVDDEDFGAVSKFSWYCITRRNRHGVLFYAGTNAYCGNRRCRIVLMHRLIMPGFKEIDHRNGDGLNNTRINLRAATRSQNKANSRKSNGISRFKGVTFNKQRQKWMAQIGCNNKNLYLGRYASEEDAARAYDVAAVRIFGEFARPNFP